MAVSARSRASLAMYVGGMTASNGPLSSWNRTFTAGDGEATTISARGSPTSGGQEKVRLSAYSASRLSVTCPLPARSARIWASSPATETGASRWAKPAASRALRSCAVSPASGRAPAPRRGRVGGGGATQAASSLTGRWGAAARRGLCRSPRT